MRSMAVPSNVARGKEQEPPLDAGAPLGTFLSDFNTLRSPRRQTGS